MAINFSNLETYVDEQRLPLIKKSVLGARTIGLINLQTGVKKASALNLINVTPTIQAGNCGFSDAGTATLSQRVLNAELLKVNMEYCDKDFLQYWTNFEVRSISAGKENMPFEEYFTTSVIEGINEKMEKLVWTGNKDNAGEFDGLLTLLAGEDEVVSASGTGVYNAVKNAYKACPIEVLPKAVIFLGADSFRELMMEMVEKNFYHYPADGAMTQEFVLPGTNTKVVAVNGLNGTKKIVVANPENLFFGCDMLDDMESFDFFYSKDNRTYRLVVSFNGGTQVAYPNEVVVGTIA